MYREHCPNPALLPYIETYWTFSSLLEEKQTVKVLPDGCVDILLNCEESITDSELPSFRPYIVGAMTTFSDIIYSNPTKMFGVRFKPGGITAFIHTPIHELTNQRVEMSLLETVFDKIQFRDALAEKNSIEEIICYIDSYLLSKLNSISIPDQQVIATVNLIKWNKGCLPVKDILNEVCLSQRQFERKFKSAIGISPKAFSSVVRFQNTRELLQQQPRQSLFLTAVDCGYYDHAHLIREFKKFTGNTPKR